MPCRSTARRTARTGSAAGSCAPATHRTAPRRQNDCRSRPGRTTRHRSWIGGVLVERQYTATNLIELERFEQRLEITLAEALVTLALDDFEKARADDVLREDLQQQALALSRSAVDQDAPRAQTSQVFAVTGYARLQRIVITLRRILEADATGVHALHGGEDIGRAEGHMLDPFALVIVQKLLDLRSIVLALVERNADLPIRTGHGFGKQARNLAFDVEVADLAEIEYPLVEVRPSLHVAALHVVRQMIDVGEPGAARALALRGALDGHEVDIVDFVRAVTVHQIQIRPADSLDRRNIELHGPDRAAHLAGAARHRLFEGRGGVAHTKCHGIDRRAVLATKLRGLAARLHVEDEVDAALLVAQHVLGAVARHCGESHGLKYPREPFRIRAGELHEFEAVGAEWIVEQIRGHESALLRPIVQ